MATPLSILNLMDGGWRTLLSVTGISIAIVLIFMQLGFLGAVTDTAVVYYDKMKFRFADLLARLLQLHRCKPVFPQILCRCPVGRRGPDGPAAACESGEMEL